MRYIITINGNRCWESKGIHTQPDPQEIKKLIQWLFASKDPGEIVVKALEDEKQDEMPPLWDTKAVLVVGYQSRAR